MIASGLPVPQNVDVPGAVNVFEPSVGVTVTLCVLESVLVQLTGDILIALTLSTAEELSAPEVREMLPPVPSFEVPVLAAPLYN